MSISPNITLDIKLFAQMLYKYMEKRMRRVGVVNCGFKLWRWLGFVEVSEVQ